MTKTSLSAGILVACVMATALHAQAEQQNEGWVFGPAFKPGWDGKYTLAVTAGYLDPDTSLASANASLGLQFSLNCPWFQPPQGAIRQQFNLNRFDDGDFQLTTLEINPRYYWDLSPNLSVGAGPGFGYVWTDAPVGQSPDLWALQAGLDLDYRVGGFYAGIGTRYQWTENETVGVDSKGLDNWLTMLKVGVNF